MSYLAEIDNAVAKIKKFNRDLTVLQCTTEYPCKPEHIGLNMIDEFKRRYNCKVGLSDHSGSIYAGLAAATLGAEMIEIHVTLSKEMFGPDVRASLSPSELKQLVEGVRLIEKALLHPVDKNKITGEKEELRRMFGKSIVAARDLPAGTILKMDNLALKKPGTGLKPEFLSKVIGKKLKRELKYNEPLVKDCL
jgi:N,N'-diacetyllegionaminate synthase